MTTPNQPAPDGAFVIGGSGASGGAAYGQEITDKGAAQLMLGGFTSIAAISNPLDAVFAAMSMFADQLLKLPLEVLKLFEPMIPGDLGAAFNTVGGAVNAIIGFFQGLGPLLTNTFNSFITTSYNVLSSAFQQILDIINGLFVVPINSAVQGVKDWFFGLFNQTQYLNSAGQFDAAQLLGSISQTVVSGLTTALSDIGTAISGTAGTVAGVIDGIVNGLLGLFGSGWGVSDAQSAAASIAEQQAATAAGVASLQQQSSTAAQSGASAFVDFSTMADATSLGASFAQFYSGTGTSTWGIVSGRVSVVGAAAAGRVARAVYTALGTLTDYQRVSAVFSSSQMVTSFGFLSASVIYGFNYIDGRSDATGANCVRVIFANGSLWFGAVIAGVWTQWTSQGHTFRPGAIYSLECGTSGGIRQYKVLCNSVPILVWTEVGTASLLGSSYRKSGLGAEWQVGYDGGGGVFYAGPGNVAAFAVADSTIPSLIGSIGRAYRASTTVGLSGAASTAYNPVTNGLFDTVEYASTDLSFDTTTGKWTVTKRGNYLISAQMIADLTNQSGLVSLMVNGVVRVSGGAGPAATVTCMTALSPGDYVQVAYFAYTNLTVSGTATGRYTWLQIARVTEDVVL